MNKFCKYGGVALLVALLTVGCQKPPQSSTPETDSTTEAVQSATPSATNTTPAMTPDADASPQASGSPQVSGSPQAMGDGTPIQHDLKPLPERTGIPVITQKKTILMTTDAGEITIELYPEAAPNAVQRFVELVQSGFYNDTPVSRVVDGFVAQFGVNWRDPHNQWEKKNFEDDPSYFALERGTLAFAKGGPDTNSTQVFINFGDNSNLADPSMNFTTFGKVTKGMDVVDKFVRVGDPSMGLDQMRLWTDGGTYLESLTVKPTMIEKVQVVE